MSEDELPPLSTLLRLKPSTIAADPTTKPRRSLRKHATALSQSNDWSNLDTIPELFVSSRQRRSPVKQSVSSKTSNQRSYGRKTKLELESIPCISSTALKTSTLLRENGRTAIDVEIDKSLSIVTQEEETTASRRFARKQSLQHDSSSDKENSTYELKDGTTNAISNMSRITQAAKLQKKTTGRASKLAGAHQRKANPYVSREAHCEDLNESSGTDGEDTDTDLSGFIVDDDATLSFDGSAIEISSDESDRDSSRARHKPKEVPQVAPRRRLVRGRQRNLVDPDREDETADLSNALRNVVLGEKVLEKEKNSNRRKTIEVIDLTSSPAPKSTQCPREEIDSRDSHKSEDDPLALSAANLVLHPSSESGFQLLPMKLQIVPTATVADQSPSIARPVTPPATPPKHSKRPQSPTKLKSPSKLLSPSKRGLEASRSPVRQSMDAFWDHNVINEWTDTFSPKKTVFGSPQRKNLLNQFKIHEDDDSSTDLNDSKPGSEVFDESSDSLPSPCESPSKNKSASPSKLATLHASTAKRKEAKAAKRKFDSERETFALNLLGTLDCHITASKISKLSASTGGIKIIWSKTLRSTAGRANWKRSVTKASGSPVKGNTDNLASELLAGAVVQHFASIELAEKIIDREERLVDTLAHEFCHLANFMVSNIRDQPHGSSFQQWGRKVTAFLRSSAAGRLDGYRPSWKKCEVTTKHSYVVEYKYLFICNGRPKEKRTLTEKFLDLDDEEGCGAEYGRHSKSIDTDKQRCGRCKGILVQVRPTPRAVTNSPRKQSPRKKQASQETSINGLERLVASVDLSD